MIYLIVALLIITTRPYLLFSEDGSIRRFGSSRNNTFFNLPVFLYTLATIISFLFQSLSVKIS